MSPGARGELPADRAAPARRDAPPPKPQYGYPPPYYQGFAAPPASTWLGAPLISMANYRRGGKPFVNRDDAERRDDHFQGRHVQLSKMAMQAQGAPLIIQGRYGNQRRFAPPPDLRTYRKPEGKQFVAYDRCDIKPENNVTRNPTASTHVGRAANMDAVSVTSDESSGSANSEAALPRIIKPRKRRKKDRKPTNLAGQHEVVSRKHDVNEDCAERCSPGPGAIYQPTVYDDVLPTTFPNYRGDATVPYRVGAKVVNYSDGLLRNYPFGVVADDTDNNKYGQRISTCESSETVASVCQCRYCDPSGQIWDIDSVGFSELFDENSTVDFAPTKLEDSMKVVGPNNKKTNDSRERDATLRRSWSDPSSSHYVPSRKIGEEISLAAGDAVSSAPDLLYSLFSSTPLTTRTGSLFERSVHLSSVEDPSSHRVVPDLKLESRPENSINLEVSSEIVTSLNGHRDLEIKFFSASPPATASKADNFFADNNVKCAIVECASEYIKCSNEVASEIGDEAPKVESKLKSEILTEVT